MADPGIDAHDETATQRGEACTYGMTRECKELGLDHSNRYMLS